MSGKSMADVVENYKATPKFIFVDKKAQSREPSKDTILSVSEIQEKKLLEFERETNYLL
jgi:hypothetical protein